MRKKRLRELADSNPKPLSSGSGVNVHVLTEDVNRVELDLLQITGDKSQLLTADKESLIAAINEIHQHKEVINSNLGEITELSTDAKDNLVIAINELNDNILRLTDLLETHLEEVVEDEIDLSDEW